MNPAQNCPGRALPCCTGCQRLGAGEFLPTIRSGKPGYCVDRWPPADEIARELEEMPL